MKRLLKAAVLISSAMVVYGQEPLLDPSQLQILPDSVVRTVIPVPVNATLQPLQTATLATWPYQYLSPRDGNTYTGTIVGGNPFNRGARTTSVPVVLIPLRIQFTGSPAYNFDPTSADNGCLGAGRTAMSLVQGSPILSTVPNYTINGVNVGTATFPDAFQKASFWTSTSAPSAAYHLGFSVSVAAKQTISVANNTANGTAYNFGGCSTNATTADNPPRLGLININYLDPLLQGIITSLGIQPNQFPFFVIYGVVISDGSASTTGNCCILGYHNGSGAPLAPGQTYGIGAYDQSYLFGAGTKDISPISHEFMEWVNDPSAGNPTPAWGNIGQVSGCQTNLEVGDPLSGTLMPAVTMGNGVTYHMQEQAFFSWFLGTPITGAGGKYSSNGTFAGTAKACPAGGTN